MAIHVVVGGQFGSEGKGAFTAALADKVGRGLAAIRVGGPNAGHTVIDRDGQEWKLRQIPVAAVIRPDASLFIAPGSEIDEEVLNFEIAMLDAAGYDVSSRLYIDREATLISGTDSPAEHGLIQRIGSTGKGIGAARAARIWREADLYRGDKACDTLLALEGIDPDHVIIEGTQGYGLGLHAGYYPFCTSRDCRAIDFLAECGISPWAHKPSGPTLVWVVFRPYPIRVAGNSGPMYDELDWATLAERHGDHIKPEHTTVTQKIRRVGEWDARLAANAMAANGGPNRWVRAVMMMTDYVVPHLYGSTRPVYDADLDEYEKVWVSSVGPIAAFGTGPNTIMWREFP